MSDVPPRASQLRSIQIEWLTARTIPSEVLYALSENVFSGHRRANVALYTLARVQIRNVRCDARI